MRLAKPLAHAREQVRASNVDGVCEQAGGVGRAPRPGEVDEPGSVRELVLHGAGGLDCEPALPHTGGTGERHETVLLQQARHLFHLALTAHERRRRRGQIAVAPADDGDTGDRRVVREHRLLEPPELRPRLESQLVGQDPARLLKPPGRPPGGRFGTAPT